MITLAQKPVTFEDRNRRSLALVLDNAFGRGSAPKDFRLLVPDFEVLLDKLMQSLGGRAATVAKALGARLDALEAELKGAQNRREETYARWLRQFITYPTDYSGASTFANDLRLLDEEIRVLRAQRSEIFSTLELLTK